MMLSKGLIEDVLQAALETGDDFSEIFVEDRYTHEMTLQSSRLEKSIAGRDFGIGIRVFSGLQSVYAHTNDYSREGLLKAAKTAADAIQRTTSKKTIRIPLVQETIQTINPIEIMPHGVEKSRKLDVLQKANDIARNYDQAISQVIVRLLDEEQNILVANSEGKFIEDQQIGRAHV